MAVNACPKSGFEFTELMRLKSKPETEGVVGLAVTIRRDAAVIALVYFEKYYYLNFTQSIK